MKRAFSSLFITCFLGLHSASEAESGAKERNVNGISDNSFLVEEAYNQEAGVVQHITTLTRSVDRANQNDTRTWDYTFTQEWPLGSQNHQFSYTVPYGFQTGSDGNNGLRDVLMNYRYQLLMDKDLELAIAPRLSGVIPTGNHVDGFGDDVYGFQFNLPVSKVLSDEWCAHFNAGLTYLPDAHARLNNIFSDEGEAWRQNAFSARHDLIDYNLGASLIWAAFPKLHFLLEGVTNWNHAIDADSGLRNENFSAILSPGARYAVDTPGGVQIVFGLGAPIGLTQDAMDYGVLFYLSVEHDFIERKK